MKEILICVILALVFSCSSTKKAIVANTDFSYAYSLNLKELKADQLKVTLVVNKLEQETTTFCFPKIVPGIYGEMNFGQYIQSLEAFDRNGNQLQIEKTDVNCWLIRGAEKLKTITYEVDDSWEEFGFDQQEGFYRSAASSFDEARFVLNNNCLFGYFREKTDWPVQLTIQKPDNFYGATGLKRQQAGAVTDQDVFFAKDYHELVDNPILYAIPDTTLVTLPGIEVEIACYSNSGEKLSGEIAKFITPLLENQSIYLGGHLPVSRYSFLIYHNFDPTLNGYAGDGLEHSYSTLILYNMPVDLDILKHSTYGIASHEFFHILMPLGLHSYEIAEYDFNEPQFSKHLWLYEGMTEYFTMHMPIENGIISLAEFVRQIEEKIKAMKEFDPDIALTKLSSNAMQMQDQYYNVYLKGALVNLCLDIQLNALSEGRYNAKQLVFDLIQKYGRDRPFKDDALFEEIVSITGYQEISTFIDNYMGGTKALPLKAQLLSVGLALDVETDQITILENLTEEQKQLRQYWIGQ